MSGKGNPNHSKANGEFSSDSGATPAGAKKAGTGAVPVGAKKVNGAVKAVVGHNAGKGNRHVAAKVKADHKAAQKTGHSKKTAAHVADVHKRADKGKGKGNFHGRNFASSDYSPD